VLGVISSPFAQRHSLVVGWAKQRLTEGNPLNIEQMFDFAYNLGK
jgi:hypothetical protein